MVKVEIGNEDFLTHVEVGEHKIVVDEPIDNGGGDKGPTPTQLLLSSLGSCVAITLRMYSRQKGWELGDINVGLTVEKVDGKKKIIEELSFGNQLETEQIERLKEIAKRCPVSKMISSETEIVN